MEERATVIGVKGVGGRSSRSHYERGGGRNRLFLFV
jgi:hypothetical protein